MEKHLLIAIDDSATSAQALDYVASMFKDAAEVFFRIGHCLPADNRPIPSAEDSRNSLLPETSLGKSNTKAKGYLQRGVEKLKSYGISEERISTTLLHGSDKASAILAYADKELLDAVVVARRGVGLMGELLMGSVSSSLFEKSRATPLWVLDGTVASKKLLVPVDGSPQSLLALDHLAHIFTCRTDMEFILFHAQGFLSPLPVCRPEDFYDKWGKEWCDIHLAGDGCLYAGPMAVLTEAGIPKECITALPVSKTMEQSSAIVNCARKNGCGTIVIGRRPESQAKGFLGGISRRTIKQTENTAVWVVG